MSPVPDFQRGDGLLPTIAQDAKSQRVLMLAWMNSDAFEETRRTGYATYYSRTRKKLWRKGEVSGHRQRVLSISVDCDADTILLQVEQTGAACHEGYASCFFRQLAEKHFKVVPLQEDHFEIVESRLVDPRSVYH